MKNRLRAALKPTLFVCALLLIAAAVPFSLVLKTLRRRPRSLWTGTPIITMATNARAERRLGVEALSLVTHTYYVTSAFDVNLSRLRVVPVAGLLVPFAVFVWACLWFDRLHFYCDSGILPSGGPFQFHFGELWTYRLLRLKVFLWTYGADVRSRIATLALGEPNCCTDCKLVGKACICEEDTRTRYVARLRGYACAIFSMGDMIEYTPGSRNDLFFWPIDLAAESGEKYRPAYPSAGAVAPLRVVHAPNHRMFKGTRFLEQAVAELKAEGVGIDLVVVEAVPNQRAIEIYRSADVIFDQCLVGFHGYVALEGMALGKPVMCFIRKPEQYLLASDECPLINIRVETIKSELRRLAANRAELHDLGKQGRRYIERYFTPEAFAGRLQRAYEQLGVMP